MKKALGIDIGGTKVAVAIINETGEIEYQVRVESQVQSAETMFSCVINAIDDLLRISSVKLSELSGIGIGLPGKVDSENGVAVFQNNLPWEKFPIVERLKEVYGELAIQIQNDVKVAAYAEYRLKNVSKNDLFSYVTISTGIAATSILNHKILNGSGFSGEIGFLEVPVFGKRLSLEAACAGPGITQLYQEKSGQGNLSTKDIFNLWRANDSIATAVISEVANGIALGLQSIICILDPKYIVLGGSVAAYNEDFILLLKDSLKRRLHPQQEHILANISVSTLKGDNGLIGAGLMVL